MNKKCNLVFLMLAAVLVLGLSLSGCATTSSIGGTVDTHGLFSSAKEVTNRADEIASYSVILGLLDSGYAEYVAKVKAAEDQGMQINTVTVSYFGFFAKITAYASR